VRREEEGACSSASNVDEDLVSGVLSGDNASLFLVELQLSQNGIIALNKAGAEFFLRDFNLKKKDTLGMFTPLTVLNFKMLL